MSTTYKVHVSGKWDDRDSIMKLMERLEDTGRFVVEHKWPVYNIPTTALSPRSNADRCRDGATKSLESVRNADVFIGLYTDLEHKYHGTTGELGAALVLGKYVILLIPPEAAFLRRNLFANHPNVRHIVESEEALMTLLGWVSMHWNLGWSE